jgi:hypothetical protein
MAHGRANGAIFSRLQKSERKTILQMQIMEVDHTFISLMERGSSHDS